MNKQRLLFVMNNLHCGGAEKALVSLLQTIDYTRFEVDLLLFRKEGLFLNQVPKTVNHLKAPSEYSYFDMSFLKAIFKAFVFFKWPIIWNRIAFTKVYKSESHPGIREQKTWKYISASLPKLKGHYDLAVGFLENSPNNYCIEKVSAHYKLGMIHSDYEALGLDPKRDLHYFEKFTYVATISEQCVAVLQRNFTSISNKFILLKNITAVQLIHQLAKEPIAFTKSALDLVTIGRLVPLKGFDLLLDAAAQLKDSGLAFKWYIIGDGPMREELRQQISHLQLTEQVFLLGLLENPYPYLEQCDFYVHTSKYEGKSVAIDEAKILQKPIIVTNFSTVKDQITDGFNGSIVDMAGIAIAKGILDLSANPSLQAQFRLQLAQEKMGNEEEVKKIYQLVAKGK